ncbi:hypothetical protein IscW_ISCW023384, partial [Ixodes scapularis]
NRRPFFFVLYFCNVASFNVTVKVRLCTNGYFPRVLHVTTGKKKKNLQVRVPKNKHSTRIAAPTAKCPCTRPRAEGLGGQPCATRGPRALARTIFARRLNTRVPPRTPTFCQES